jgi:Pin2-interacting protein X1
MGLGATKTGQAGDETFGLEVLSGVLGRLNGQSDETLRKESEARRDARLSSWQVRKWGGKGFVSGGFLVTKTIENEPAAVEEKDIAPMKPASSGTADMEEDRQNQTDEEEPQSEEVSERRKLKLERRARKEARRLRREKKRQKTGTTSTSADTADDDSERPTPTLSSSAASNPNSRSGSSTPLSASTRRPVVFRRRPGTRNTVRPDQKALNEVSGELRVMC